MEEGSFRRSALAGAASSVGALALVAALATTAPFERLEHAVLDLASVGLGPPRKAPDEIVLLLVDSKSLAAMRTIWRDREEPWPWRRLFYGAVADFLARSGARAVAFDLDLSGASVHDAYLDDSAETARAFRAAGNVYLALNFKALAASRAPSGPAGEAAPPGEDASVAELLERSSVRVDEEARVPFEARRFDSVQVPYGPFAEAGVARGFGAVNGVVDPGGTLRRAPLLVRFGDRLVPSLPFAVFLGLRADPGGGGSAGPGLKVRSGPRLQVRGRSVPLDPEGRFRILWYGGERTFRSFTIYETIRAALADAARRASKGSEEPLYWSDPEFAEGCPEDAVAAQRALFRDKVVFVGSNASELGDVWSNPWTEAVPGAEVHATVLGNLLRSEFLERAPAGLRLLALAALTFVAGLGVALAGGEARGLAVFAGAVLGYLALFVLLLERWLFWTDAAAPLAGAALAYGSTTLAQYSIVGRLRRKLRKTFDKVLQREVVDQLLREPWRLHLGGEERELTVLFSDLESFSSLAERLPPDGLVASLNSYFTRFAAVLLETGAYIDKYIGDGVMAVWGAPREDPRHARTACLAALRLRDELARLGAEGGKGAGRFPATRIGINSGRMVVGMVGSEGAAHYTVMGDEVVIASRLEGANKVYGTRVLVGERCYELAREAVAAREIDLVVLKGKTKPLRIFEPLGEASCLDGAVRAKMELFAAGLELYRARRWAEARERFEELLSADPGDGPARELAKRCERFAAEPPPPSWGGEFVMVEK